MAADDELDERPRKGGKKKKQRDVKQGSRTMLYVLGGGGVVLLGLCCLGGILAGFVAYLATPGDPEKDIVGKWQFDGDYGQHVTIGKPPPTLIFDQDGAFEMIAQDRPGQPAKGKWKTTSKKGNAITVEVSYTFVTPLAKQTITESHEYVVYQGGIAQARSARDHS
jgi:hypothetical protein